MTNKYKVSELAKDFGLASKEITALLIEASGVEKKSGAALNEEEIAIVFDVLTQKNQVKSFDEYFATGAAAREAAAKAREDEKNKRLAEQMAILEQLKAAAAAQNAEKEKPEEKAETKKTADKNETKVKEKTKVKEQTEETKKEDVKIDL